ncbi:MAG: thiamine-phosphate kinase [Omnitrophica bacterium]|nr:thiamine-phosphate kinase [Candidatus Omnitrophota bacterium]
MKELEFVDYLTRKFKVKRPVVMGIGDDCAVLEHTRGKYMLLTSDMLIEGVHFERNTAPFAIGWKAMAVNISDIAAMGGVPEYALVSVGVPKKKNIKFLKKITDGIEALCRKFDISVIGGDTNRAGKTVLSIALMGEVEKKRLITRSGARPGDLLFVTGKLGCGRVKHLSFLPRLREARILGNFKISSMIDLSDGLALDLNRLARASSVGARVHKELIPIFGARGSFKEMISRGEDFELLFTVSPGEAKKIMKHIRRKKDLAVTRIGEITRVLGVRIVEESGRSKLLKSRGFRHL